MPTDTNHNFVYEACINPVFAKCILPILVHSDKSDSYAEITLKIKDSSNLYEIPLELSSRKATKITPSSEILFLKLPDTIPAKCSSGKTNPDKNLQLTITGVKKDETITITLYTPSKFTGYSEAATEAVRNEIKNLTKINKEKLPAFDFTYRVDESIAIPDPTDPESFFDSNHIKNKFVISQIDTSSIGNIAVAKQSRK